MSAIKHSTEHLSSLAEEVCQKLGNTQVIHVDNPSGTMHTGTRILRVVRDGKEIEVKIPHSFLEVAEDDTLISYLITAITMTV
jgi:hypothetical protein